MYLYDVVLGLADSFYNVACYKTNNPLEKWYNSKPIFYKLKQHWEQEHSTTYHVDPVVLCIYGYVVLLYHRETGKKLYNCKWSGFFLFFFLQINDCV